MFVNHLGPTFVRPPFLIDDKPDVIEQHGRSKQLTRLTIYGSTTKSISPYSLTKLPVALCPPSLSQSPGTIAE